MAGLGDIVKGYGQLRAGKEAKRSGKLESVELEKRASTRRAVGHRDAAEERRNADLAYSRALAVAAASGAGVSDPTVVKLFADLQAEGDYRVLSRLFVAEDEAQGIAYRSKVALREGKARSKLSKYQAASSALGAGESFADAYGG